jgi:hypothetical protein
MDADARCFPPAVRAFDRFAPPQAAQGVQRRQHLFAPLAIALRRQDEVVSVPTRRDRKTDATPRQVVDHRPLFGNAQRIMERQDDTAGA